MSQAEVFELMHNGYDDSTISELTEETDSSKFSVTDSLEKLRKKGLVEKNEETLPKIFYLTEKGEERSPDSLKGMVI